MARTQNKIRRCVSKATYLLWQGQTTPQFQLCKEKSAALVIHRVVCPVNTRKL